MQDAHVHLQGVVLCVTTLVMALAQDHLEPYAVCYQKAVDRLHRVSFPVCRGWLLVIAFTASCRTRVLDNICVL